eukprot:scaffold649_cov347-Pavlova_lutheri.AAC.27
MARLSRSRIRAAAGRDPIGGGGAPPHPWLGSGQRRLAIVDKQQGQFVPPSTSRNPRISIPRAGPSNRPLTPCRRQGGLSSSSR